MNNLFNFFINYFFFRHKATFYNSHNEKLCCKDATDVQVKVWENGELSGFFFYIDSVSNDI